MQKVNILQSLIQIVKSAHDYAVESGKQTSLKWFIVISGILGFVLTGIVEQLQSGGTEIVTPAQLVTLVFTLVAAYVAKAGQNTKEGQ